MRTTLVRFAPALADPFARTQRWPSRMHPRRDPEGHPEGGGGDPAPEGDPKPEPEGDPKPEPDKDPDDDKTDWKAQARKHEARAKENAQAAKELAALKKSQMSDAEKIQAERDEARAEADAAKAEVAREKAARKYGLTDEDLEFLDGVPADKFDARAKALSERLKKAGTSTAGTSGGEVTGGKPPVPLQEQIAAAQKARDFPLVVALKEQLHHSTTK